MLDGYGGWNGGMRMGMGWDGCVEREFVLPRFAVTYFYYKTSVIRINCIRENNTTCSVSGD